MKAREEECTRALALNQQRRQELYAKQGRGTQFTSRHDRDRWIEKELKYGMDFWIILIYLISYLPSHSLFYIDIY